MRDFYYSHDDANLQELIAACDEALNWADSNARAFSIETAPRGKWVQLFDGAADCWERTCLNPDKPVPAEYTHWRPLQTDEKGLPAPLERLGEVLRRIKGVG